MKKFNFLRQEVKKENKKQLNNDLEYLNELKTLQEKEQFISKWIFTKSIEKQYKLNKATTEKQKEKVLIKLVKEYHNQQLEKKNKKIEQAEFLTSGECQEMAYILGTGSTIQLSTEWTKNRTWGANPHTELWAFGEYTTGAASGCGYDKLSTAIAQALNKNKYVMSLLYKAKNKLQKLPYGSGYGVLPYFEGGVGYSSIRNVLQAIGFKEVAYNETKNNDFSQFNFAKGLK